MTKQKDVFLIFAVLLLASIAMIFSSVFILRICVILLFIMCVYLGIREKSLLNPYFLFMLVPFSLLIYANISNYHVELKANTWMIAIINISAFLIALMVTKPFKERSSRTYADVNNRDQLLFHTIFLLLLSYIPTIYSLIFKEAFFLASVFYLFSYPAILCAMKSKNKILIAVILILHILPWFQYVSKMSVLSLVITLLIGYEKYYQKRKTHTVILIILGSILVIAAFGFANQGRSSGEFEGTVLQYYTKYGGVVWNWNERLFMPYMYITTPWTNLQYVMDTQDTRTYGLWFIKPILGYLQLDGFFSKEYNIIPSSTFNTFTYISVCFKDFGFFGSCLSSLFLGFFTKKIYSRYLISKSPLDAACYALVAQSVLEMFFSNHFFTQSYPFTIVIIMAIYKVLFYRKKVIGHNKLSEASRLC